MYTPSAKHSSKMIQRREMFAFGSHQQKAVVDTTRILKTLTSIPLEWSTEEDYEPPIPFVVKFSSTAKNGHLALIADESGTIAIADTLSLREDIPSIQKRWSAHTNAIFDCMWTSGDTRILSGAGDQTVKVWDTETSQLISELRGHWGSIKSIDCMRSNPSIVGSASRDGTVRLWDCRTSTSSSDGGIVQSFQVIDKAHEFGNGTGNRKSFRKRNYCQPGAGSSGSVTDVKFSHDDQVLMSAGASDGKLKFWDLRKTPTSNSASTITSTSKKGTQPIHEFCPCTMMGCLRPHGAISIDTNHDGSQVLVSSCDHRIYVLDIASFPSSSPQAVTLQGHLNNSFYVRARFSPDGQYVLGGSSDDNLYMWDLGGAVGGLHGSPLVFGGHEGEVNGVDWCPTEFGKAISCADDRSVRVWTVGGDGGSLVGGGDRDREVEGEDMMVNTPVTNTPVSTTPRYRNRTIMEMWNISLPGGSSTQ